MPRVFIARGYHTSERAVIMISTLRKIIQPFEKYILIYNIFMALLSVGIVVLLIIDATDNMPNSAMSISDFFDKVVWIIFTIDYIARFLISENKQRFFRNNIIDLIAILPFNILFQGFRAARLLKLIYMLRAFAYLNRAYKRICTVLKTNDFDHVIWFTCCTIFIGAISIAYTDDMNMGDALWWSFVTTTTVGYGDIAPQSLGGRIIAVFLMIIGIGFLSTLTSTISTFFISKTDRSSSYKDDELSLVIDKLNHFDDLSIEDLNHMHYALLTLKENTSDKK